jgi:hypothetical protein
VKVYASVVEPGLPLDHCFRVPDYLIDRTKASKFSKPFGNTMAKYGYAELSREFIDWCSNSLCSFVLYLDGCEHRIRCSEEDYLLLKLKYMKDKESKWQRII